MLSFGDIVLSRNGLFGTSVDESDGNSSKESSKGVVDSVVTG